VITLQDLTRRFEAVTAVDALSLDIREGEMFGLIGPDGAGKTTTLRLILGLLAPDSGSVRTCGCEPVRQRRTLAGQVGYLSQRFSLYGDLSCDENMAFFAEIHGVRKWRPRRDELLTMLRLAPFRDRLADRLSGGMKQKLALACTLIHTPRLLVLDEPTTGVDPVSRREFWKILFSLQKEGLTILLTTPYLDEAERCQRVALMHQGRLLLLDTPDALRRSAGTGLIELLAHPRRRALDWLRARPGIGEVEVFGERLHITLRAAGPPSARDIDDLAQGLRLAGVEVESIREIVPTLEDRFIAQIRSADKSQTCEVRS
jgi:ABC-2 type transport system ATP-binding protein